MSEVKVLGIDLAKHHFQLHGVSSTGKRILKKTLTPEKSAILIGNLKPCLIGLEACGGAH